MADILGSFGRATAVAIAGVMISVFGQLGNPARATATHLGAGVVDATSLAVEYSPSAQAGVSAQLLAHLRADDGSPVVGVGVEFLRRVEFLGPREVRLGTATTDAWGTAAIPLSATPERMSIVARFAGDARYAPSDVTTEIELLPGVGGSPAGGEGEGASLALIQSVMPPALAVTAAIVWLLLLGVALSTLLAIRRSRPIGEQAEEGVEA